MKNFTIEQLEKMWYVDFVANLNETNRCPWWKNAVRKLVQNTFLKKKSKVLDVWCNTWYISFEIARLKKCLITGLDINENMINQSKSNNDDKNIKWLVKFVLWDWTNLNFSDNTFDLVTSWGSTIFMNDIYKWLLEYKRVCKDWWFIWDINFFYTDKIPTGTINEINNLLWINIQPWKKDYFLDLYEKVWLEKYYIFTDKTYKPTLNELEKYCKLMIDNSVYANIWNEIKELAYKKFYNYMSLFHENNKYLSYWVFVYRKRPEKYKEQITLFWY